LKNIEKYNIPRTGLISLTEEPPKLADEILGPEQLINITRELRKRVS